MSLSIVPWKAALAATLAVAAASPLAGCAKDEPPGDVPGLDSTKIGDEATFKATRTVHVQVSIAPATGKPGYRALRVMRANHELLSQGAVDGEHPFSLDYPLSSADTELIIGVGDEEKRVTVGGDRVAQATFE
jgi:hypothetical protein